MVELTMASSISDHKPAVTLKLLNDFSHRHNLTTVVVNVVIKGLEFLENVTRKCLV
jgi:hypothetical protein